MIFCCVETFSQELEGTGLLLDETPMIVKNGLAYNENAIKFYDKKGYHPRMYTDIKKLK